MNANTNNTTRGRAFFDAVGRDAALYFRLCVAQQSRDCRLAHVLFAQQQHSNRSR